MEGKTKNTLKNKWRGIAVVLLLVHLIAALALPVSAEVIHIQPVPALDNLSDVDATTPTNGDILAWNNTSNEWYNTSALTDALGDVSDLQSDMTDAQAGISANAGNITELKDTAIIYIMQSGNSSAIATGEKGHLSIPFDCTITGWILLADQSGSIVIDVWKDTYANFPPAVADTIAGSEKPTLSAAQKNQDLDLGTWTTSVSEGDILAFNVDSCSTITRVTLTILVTRS